MNVVKLIIILILLGLLVSKKLRKAVATVLFGLVLLFYGQPILNAVLWLARRLVRLASQGGTYG